MSCCFMTTHVGRFDIFDELDLRFPFLSAALPFPFDCTDELPSAVCEVTSSSWDLRPYALGAEDPKLFLFFDEADESCGLSMLDDGELALFLPLRSPDDPSDEL